MTEDTLAWLRAHRALLLERMRQYPLIIEDFASGISCVADSEADLDAYEERLRDLCCSRAGGVVPFSSGG